MVVLCAKEFASYKFEQLDVTSEKIKSQTSVTLFESM
jgi:hypothetical protein